MQIKCAYVWWSMIITIINWEFKNPDFRVDASKEQMVELLRDLVQIDDKEFLVLWLLIIICLKLAGTLERIINI